MKGLSRRLRDLPIRTKLGCVLALTAAELALLVALGASGMWVLSTLRAYVGGEGLWAKAQKDAVYALSSYAVSRDERDWEAYLEHLKIPLGDRAARIELEKPSPDLTKSDAGFIAGGNHPDDARAMAHLFRRFRRVGYIARAIELCREADVTIARLETEADELHRLAAAGRLTSAGARARLDRIAELNGRLTRVENDFSYTLGQASRWAKRVLLLAMLAGAALLGGLGLLAAWLVGRSVVDGVAALSAGAARVETGDLSGRVSVPSRDEIGGLADAFNRMTEGLAKLDRMKSDFIATASHELRTPLTLAMAPLESLLAGDHGDMTADQTALLRVMHNNSVRQLQLVTGLLDFSRLEAGRVEVSREPVEVSRLTRSIVDDFRPLARGKGVALETRAELADPVVLLDRYLYERIVFNLVSNAVKFTPRGGSVRVSLECRDGALSLAVRDDGIGISLADQATLFTKFRQLDSSSTRRFEGTGLGLALVREFCALLGGGVTVESAPGRGSEFVAVISAPTAAAAGAPPVRASSVLAPRWDPEAEAAAMAAPTSPAAGSAGGILIVEDNPELRAYLARLLEGLAPVRAARDGEEALRLAAQEPPEVVVADVMMPKLDGLGLCRALKADPLTSAAPVVLVTALTDRESLTRGWKAGADEYLFKPFHPKEVVTRVGSLLEAARARRAASAAMAAKNRDLEAAVTELAAANAELQTFGYSVAHDLRAPLRNLAGFCGHLEAEFSGKDLTDAQRELFKRVRGSVERMDAIILGLLQLSRVTRAELAPVAVDLADLAGSIAEELRRAHPERAVDFLVAPGMTAHADRELVRIALRNLLENAWKFTAKRSSARVEVGVMRRGRDAVFFVKDDGAGFDLRHPERLFGTFQRFHSASEFSGTGIGLATVKRVVERHGGRIWAETGVGRGSTFYFTLAAPVTEAASDRS